MSSFIENLKLDKIIRAAATVKTGSGIAALNLALVFAGFVVALTATEGILEWVLAILIFICWQAFAVFAVYMTRQNPSQKEIKVKTKQ